MHDRREGVKEAEDSSASNDNDSRSALEKHIRFFANGNNQVSFGGMAAVNTKIGLGWSRARTTAFGVALGAGVKVTGCPFGIFRAEQAVGVLNHPQSTRIFNLDGSINEERWVELLGYTQKNESGEDIITEEKLYEFLNACRAKETRPDVLGLAKRASDGEWKAYMDVFTQQNTDGVRYVTVKSLRDFYEDSEIPGREVIERFGHSS